MPTTRRLAAILFTDIVGSTAIMQNDELRAISLNKRYVTVLRQYVLSRGGEILNDYGDGSLCCFSSITEALQCAIEMQKELQKEPKVPLRIGLHVGEVFFDDGKVMGDGVNIASRVQSLGVANSIFFSSEVNSKIKNQQEFKSVSLGRFEFKNVDEPMEIFALANEGLVIPKKEEMSGKLKEIQKKSTRKKLIIIAGLFLVLVTAFFMYQKMFKAAGFSGGDRSVAVLPFENSGLNDSNVILDGITQDVISKLSKISSLQKVIAWFSVKNFKKRTKSVREIADELGVATILTGTIEKLAGNIHIYAELIDVSNNKILWGEEYNFDDKDLLSIQSKVAVKIVTALKATLTPEERKSLSRQYTENVEAYKLYLIGRSFWNKRDPASMDSAEDYYLRATRLDTNYALAYAGLSSCYWIAKKDLSPVVSKDIALNYANKALSIDSNLSEAFTSIGFIEQNFEYDWANSKRNLKKAIDRDPNSDIAHIFYGNALQYSGDAEGGLNEAKKAAELNPQSFTINWILGRNYYFAGEYDLAIKQLQRTLSIAAGNQNNTDIINWSLGLVYLEKKLYQQAENVFDKLSITRGYILDDNQIMQSYAYAIMGDKTKAKELLKKTLKERSNQLPYRVAQVYIALNDFNEAMTQLELGYEKHDSHMFWIKVDPAFNPIRNEPRFRALLKKMNLD